MTGSKRCAAVGMIDSEPSTIGAFWCRYPSQRNFGDALSPWLIARITGRPPRFLRPSDPRPKHLVVGSIISFATANCTVWGSGVLSRHDRIDPRARILAVRGPVTRARALECGAECPPLYGDPALLLPRFYRPSPAPRRHRLGVAPHFMDKSRVLAAWDPPDGFHFIDVQRPVTSVIDDLASCDHVASSSLHGLIVAHAYGIPAVWIRITNRPHGDGAKFHDYYRSTGEAGARPIPVGPSVDVERLVNASRLPRGDVDLDALWAARPFGPRGRSVGGSA